jgi:hypothetical protein
LREALDTLSQEERMVCLWKKAGFSAQEIAKFQGRSVVAVDTLFSRAKQKIRSVLGVAPGTGETRPQSKGVNGRTYEPAPARDEATDRSEHGLGC